MSEVSVKDHNRRSPGSLDSGFLPLPVGFEQEMKLFTPSALKTYLAIRFRTVWKENVQLTTAALARITRLSEDSVRNALIWLEKPESRGADSEPARQLPVYIRRRYEKEHEHSDRTIQTIYVEQWKNPRAYMRELKDSREAKGAERQAFDDEE